MARESEPMPTPWPVRARQLPTSTNPDDLWLSVTLFHENFSEKSVLTLADSSTTFAATCGPARLGSVRGTLTAATGQERSPSMVLFATAKGR